jgi:hypothetical protein
MLTRFAGALLAALMIGSLVGEVAYAAPAIPMPRPTGTVALDAVGDSGVTGTARLKAFPTSNATQVELRVVGLPANSVTEWAIKAGPCGAGGPTVFAPPAYKRLRANADGIATVTVSVPSAAILGGDYSIVIGDNQACGDVVETPAGFTVVATGLDNPRGLSFGPDGALYIAEAGRGGPGPCVPGPEGGEVCFGLSGAVTRVQGGANQRRIVTGLPSLAEPGGFAATGPHDVAFRGGMGSVVVGLGANPAARAAFGADGARLGLLYRLTRSGALSNPIDVAAYEATANPDDSLIDSNPYAVTEGAAGRAVIDAGGNSLVLVAPNGTISTLAVFPPQFVPAPPFLGLPPGTLIPAESVPTSVVIGPDGAYYVGELTGFPFPVGSARVWRVVPGQEPTVYASGFTNIIDLAFGRDGSLYVLEITTNGLLTGDLTGALKRVPRGGGSATLLTTSLVAPSGLTVGSDGSVYISNRSIFSGSGQVLRFKP